jgi:hypothetical protein
MLTWEAKWLDLESWELRDIAVGVFPELPGSTHLQFFRPYPAGSPATRLFIGRGLSLHRWNPATGALEELVPGRDSVEN